MSSNIVAVTTIEATTTYNLETGEYHTALSEWTAWAPA